jgi:O-acetylhomoserine (thiol)-lyase
MASENGAAPKSPEGDDDALRQFGFETRAIHAGHRPDPYTGASVAPLYQSSAFAFEDTESAAAYFNLQEYGNIYSRIMNPTVAAFEERVANLEGGVGAVAFASGMAAQVGAFFTMLSPGDHIVASRSIYGGTITQLKITFAKLSLDVTLVDPDDMDGWRAALRPETKALFAETIGNPGGNILDIAAVAEIAHEHGAPLLVDNTFASPYLCRPIEWGADIVLHSATKYIDGHGTSIGGIVIDAGKFNWSNGRYATIAAPSAEYHGLEFHETFGLYGYLMKLRAETLRDLGAALSPFNAFLYLLGLETLPLRMERHVSNALGVARFLAQHPMVERVRYAGLPDSPYHERAKRYLPKGPGAVFAVDLRGGRAAGQRCIEALTLWTHLANVGDTKSLVIHPASTTHRQLSDEELPATGVTPGTVRLSVGLESLDDLLWDLEKGLRAVKIGLDMPTKQHAQKSESSEETEARA